MQVEVYLLNRDTAPTLIDTFTVSIRDELGFQVDENILYNGKYYRIRDIVHILSSPISLDHTIRFYVCSTVMPLLA
jgi:hypothetical protein